MSYPPQKKEEKKERGSNKRGEKNTRKLNVMGVTQGHISEKGQFNHVECCKEQGNEDSGI